MKRILSTFLALLVLFYCTWCMWTMWSLSQTHVDEILTTFFGYTWCRTGNTWYFCNSDGDIFRGYKWKGDSFPRNRTFEMYTSLGDSHVGLCFGVPGEGKWGVLDSELNVVIEPQYDSMSRFDNDKAIVTKDGVSGLLNFRTGEMEVPFEQGYTDIVSYSFVSDHTVFLQNGLTGFLDDHGQVIVEPIYEEVGEHTNNGVIPVKTNGLWGLLHIQDNRYVAEPQYTFCDEAFVDLYIVEKDGKYGAIDSSNQTAIDLIYDSIFFEYDSEKELEEQEFIVVLDGKYGLMDYEGNERLPAQYDGLEMLYNYLLCNVGGRYGIVSRTGEYLIEPQYDSIHAWYDCELEHFDTGMGTFYHGVLDGQETSYDLPVDPIPTSSD